MNKRRSKAFVLLPILLCSCGIWDNVVLDNKNYSMSCDQFPSVVEVEQIMMEEKETIDAIKRVSPDFVAVHVDEQTCLGRAGIAITHGSHQQRAEIQEIIGGNTIAGIPYKMNNR